MTMQSIDVAVVAVVLFHEVLPKAKETEIIFQSRILHSAGTTLDP